MKQLIARVPGLAVAARLIARALDLGVVVLCLFIPTALGNRADVDDPPTIEAPVASYCDSLCPGSPANVAGED